MSHAACGRARRWGGCHRLRCHSGRVEHVAVVVAAACVVPCVVCVCVCVCVCACVCVCVCRVWQAGSRAAALLQRVWVRVSHRGPVTGHVRQPARLHTRRWGRLPYARVATAPQHRGGAMGGRVWRCAVRPVPCCVGAAQRQQQRQAAAAACVPAGSPIAWSGVGVATSEHPTRPVHGRRKVGGAVAPLALCCVCVMGRAVVRGGPCHVGGRVRRRLDHKSMVK